MAAPSLKAFTDESFLATEKAWKGKKSGSTFPTEADQLLTWVKQHMKPGDHSDSVAYGIFPKGSDEAEAVCEVVIKKVSAKSKWMKLLRLRLSPALDERIYEDDLDTFAHVVGLYAASVVGVLKLKDEHEVTTLKIFGRSAEQLSFLRALGAKLEREKLLKGHAIRMAGRWLVIENS